MSDNEAGSKWTGRKLSGLELLVGVLLVTIFIAVFSTYALVLFARTEISALNATVSNIKVALRHRLLMARIDGEDDFYLQLNNLNPMKDMQATRTVTVSGDKAVSLIGSDYPIVDTPPSYIGELDDPDLASIGTGVWFFDRTDNNLVYFVRNTEYFVGEPGVRPSIRFKVVVRYDDRDQNGEFDPAFDEFHSAEFISLHHYEWLDTIGGNE